IAVCSFIVATLLRAAIQKFRFWQPIAGYVLLPARVDALAAGVLVAMLVHFRPQWIAGNERRIRLAVLAFLMLCIGYAYVPNSQAIRLAFPTHAGHSIAFAGLLLLVLVRPVFACCPFLSARWIR